MPTPFRHLLPLAILLVALAANGALAQSVNRIDLLRPDAPALAAPGSFEVGVRTLDFVDEGRLDVLRAAEGGDVPRYDRPLTVEVWYPAALPEGAAAAGEYATVTRDPSTPTTLVGRAVRNAEPERSGAPYPLVIVSHGYPGNRYLLSHLGENLATKGYVVVSIDHTDSTYSDQAAFGSTLLNRPLDQRFVLDEVERRAGGGDALLGGLVDAGRTGLVGYSMGAYGALNLLGAGFTGSAAELPFAPPNGMLEQRTMDEEAYDGGPDERIRAAILVAPWGMNAGFWNAEGLAGFETPALFVAGSEDDVAGYENGVEAIFEGTVNAERWLLTFENARHNAAAPIPPPAESWSNGTFDHYADPVWDTVRMNNVFQHFATVFLGLYLKEDAEMAPYLDLIEVAGEGVWSLDDAGAPTEEHTHWLGFPERSALGLSLRRLPAQGE